MDHLCLCVSIRCLIDYLLLKIFYPFIHFRTFFDHKNKATNENTWTNQPKDIWKQQEINLVNHLSKLQEIISFDKKLMRNTLVKFNVRGHDVEML